MTTNQLEQETKKLFGKEIFAMTCGPSTGSRFKLEMGGKVIRERYINNPHLTEENRKYRGEYSLMVYSAWRLQNEKDKVIASWQDSNEKDGLMTLGLESLIGDNILTVSFSKQFDILINFKSGKYLNVFCDTSSDMNGQRNWTFRIEKKFIVLNNKYEVEYTDS